MSTGQTDRIGGPASAPVSGNVALLRANDLSDLSSAATARTNLGLVVGTDVQSYSAKTAAFAALTWAANKFAYFTGAAAAAVADITSFGLSLVAAANAAAARTLLGVGTGDTPTFTGVTVSGTATVNGQLIGKGTATNDSASAGYIGEYISSTVLLGSAVSLTTATAKSITSISLTAGDWELYGNVVFLPNGSTTISNVIAAINTVDNTLPTAPGAGAYHNISATLITGGGQILPTGNRRISIAATTTVYLVAQAAFGTSTMTAYGFIGARRVR